MKKSILSIACIAALCSVSAFATTTPQLNLSLILGKKLYNENYVIDADACEYFKDTCLDHLPGTVHDHESRPFDKGWVDWKPNWRAVPPHHKVVNYHISVRRPESGSDIIACGSDHPVSPDTQHVSLHVFKLFGSLHCSVIE